MAVLTVATCQFPVSADIGANLHQVKRQMVTASRRGARVAHFPEGALSGYAGTDFETFAGFDWDRLGEAAAEVADHAGRLGIWVVAGSAYRLSGARKPHNSLYVISDSGQFVERYDKRFCAGDPAGRSGALAHYSPGGRASKRGVQLVLSLLPCRARRTGADRRDRRGHRDAVPVVQPGRHAHLPRHHHARGHDCRRGLQPHLDQLPELLGPAKRVAGVLRPRRRYYHRPAAGEQVRFCLFELRDWVPVEDTESIYVQDTAAGRLHQYRKVARS